MKDLNIVKKERDELSKELKMLVSTIKADKSLLNSMETIKRLYIIVGLIRMLDWMLDDSNLSFYKFCLKTDESIDCEFDLDF